MKSQDLGFVSGELALAEKKIRKFGLTCGILLLFFSHFRLKANMQTIQIPWKTSEEDQKQINEWQRQRASATRTAYANAENKTLKEIEHLLKERFPKHPLGSWDLHCAGMEGISLRKKVPDGSMIFGGKQDFDRRQKGLISNEEWKDKRHHRALEIIGDRTRWGNRHFRLSEDARKCKVEFLKKSVILNLPEIKGKQGELLKAVSQLAQACQISVQFTLSRTHLSVTFDEMDLRKLQPGQTLEQAKIAEQGKGRRGRKRKDAATHYASHRVKEIEDRHVHPEWREPISTVDNRAIGIDLNPQWIGVTVIEVDGDITNLENVRILDHKLYKIDVPFGADQSMQQVMANAAADCINLARAWSVGLIVHEDGLGKLRWSKTSKITKTINYWSRNAFLGGIQRRCKLSGVNLSSVWSAYSSTIGNLSFDLPDACAAAAEIARRGLVPKSKLRTLLPAVSPTVLDRLRKDGKVPDAVAEAIEKAECWRKVHQIIKTAQAGTNKRSSIGYRRLHPTAQQLGSGSFCLNGRSYAVDRLGKGKGASCSARPVLTKKVRNSSNQELKARVLSTLKSE